MSLRQTLSSTEKGELIEAEVRLLLRFEIKLLLQVSDLFRRFQTPVNRLTLLWLRSAPQGRALGSTGVTRLPRYYGPVRLPAEPALLARTAELRTPPGGTSLPALRSPLADLPCPLPRRTEPLRMSVPSRLVRPAPYLRRVGVHDFTLETWGARPAQAYCALRPASLLARLSPDFVTRLPPGRLPDRAARQLSFMLTDNYMGGLLPPTGCPRRKGALRKGG